MPTLVELLGYDSGSDGSSQEGTQVVPATPDHSIMEMKRPKRQSRRTNLDGSFSRSRAMNDITNTRTRPSNSRQSEKSEKRHHGHDRSQHTNDESRKNRESCSRSRSRIHQHEHQHRYTHNRHERQKQQQRRREEEEEEEQQRRSQQQARRRKPDLESQETVKVNNSIVHYLKSKTRKGLVPRQSNLAHAPSPSHHPSSRRASESRHHSRSSLDDESDHSISLDGSVTRLCISTSKPADIDVSSIHLFDGEQSIHASLIAGQHTEGACAKADAGSSIIMFDDESTVVSKSHDNSLIQYFRKTQSASNAAALATSTTTSAPDQTPQGPMALVSSPQPAPRSSPEIESLSSHQSPPLLSPMKEVSFTCTACGAANTQASMANMSRYTGSRTNTAAQRRRFDARSSNGCDHHCDHSANISVRNIDQRSVSRRSHANTQHTEPSSRQSSMRSQREPSHQMLRQTQQTSRGQATQQTSPLRSFAHSRTKSRLSHREMEQGLGRSRATSRSSGRQQRQPLQQKQVSFDVSNLECDDLKLSSVSRLCSQRSAWSRNASKSISASAAWSSPMVDSHATEQRQSQLEARRLDLSNFADDRTAEKQSHSVANPRNGSSYTRDSLRGTSSSCPGHNMMSGSTNTSKPKSMSSLHDLISDMSSSGSGNDDDDDDSTVISMTKINSQPKSKIDGSNTRNSYSMNASDGASGLADKSMKALGAEKSLTRGLPASPPPQSQRQIESQGLSPAADSQVYQLTQFSPDSSGSPASLASSASSVEVPRGNLPSFYSSPALIRAPTTITGKTTMTAMTTTTPCQKSTRHKRLAPMSGKRGMDQTRVRYNSDFEEGEDDDDASLMAAARFDAVIPNPIVPTTHNVVDTIHPNRGSTRNNDNFFRDNFGTDSDSDDDSDDDDDVAGIGVEMGNNAQGNKPAQRTANGIQDDDSNSSNSSRSSLPELRDELSDMEESIKMDEDSVSDDRNILKSMVVHETPQARLFAATQSPIVHRFTYDSSDNDDSDDEGESEDEEQVSSGNGSNCIIANEGNTDEHDKKHHPARVNASSTQSANTDPSQSRSRIAVADTPMKCPPRALPKAPHPNPVLPPQQEEELRSAMKELAVNSIAEHSRQSRSANQHAGDPTRSKMDTGTEQSVALDLNTTFANEDVEEKAEASIQDAIDDIEEDETDHSFTGINDDADDIDDIDDIDDGVHVEDGVDSVEDIGDGEVDDPDDTSNALPRSIKKSFRRMSLDDSISSLEDSMVFDIPSNSISKNGSGPHERNTKSGQHKSSGRPHIDVVLKDQTVFHFNKLNLKRSKHVVPASRDNQRNRQHRTKSELVDFPGLLDKYQPRTKSKLKSILAWVEKLKSKGNDSNGVSSGAILSLPPKELIDLSVQMCADVCHDADGSYDLENPHALHGQVLVVARSKMELNEWESKFRDSSGASVINFATLSGVERKSLSAAKKCSLYDVILTTYDAIKSPDAAVPLNAHGRAITKKLSQDDGWYATRATTQDGGNAGDDDTPHSTKMLSMLHKIRFRLVIFVDVLGRKSYLAKADTARSRSALALGASSRFALFQTTADSADCDGDCGVMGLMKSHRRATESLASVLHVTGGTGNGDSFVDDHLFEVSLTEKQKERQQRQHRQQRRKATGLRKPSKNAKSSRIPQLELVPLGSTKAVAGAGTAHRKNRDKSSAHSFRAW